MGTASQPQVELLLETLLIKKVLTKIKNIATNFKWIFVALGHVKYHYNNSWKMYLTPKNSQLFILEFQMRLPMSVTEADPHLYWHLP